MARAALSALSSADKTVALVTPELEDQTDWHSAVSLAEDGEYTGQLLDRSTSPTRRPLATGAAAAAASDWRTSCVTLHLVRRATPVKQVFFVRHGESRWNEAQAKKDVLHMVSQARGGGGVRGCGVVAG